MAVAGSLLLLLLSNWPFTMLVTMPVNKRRMAMLPQHADPQSWVLLRH